VRGAFDRVARFLGEPSELKTGGRLPRDEARATLDALRRIDQVLQVIFPSGSA